MKASRNAVDASRRQMMLSTIGAGLLSVVGPLAFGQPAYAAVGAARFFTKNGAGRNSGDDWGNALRLKDLQKSLGQAKPGGVFAIAANSSDPSAIAIDDSQIAIKISGAPGNPITLDASGEVAGAVAGITPATFQSSRPWSVEAISGKKNAAAYITLIQGASHIQLIGFKVRGTSPDGLLKFRSGKAGPVEFSDVVISGFEAADLGRLIETDKQAFLSEIRVENCNATGIVRGFARFYNLTNGTFRNLMLDANNLDGGGKNVCQLISITNGENLLFEDVTVKNAVNAKWKEDGSPSYFQGDGIVCERGTKNVTIRRCHGSGMGDAAFDLKTTNVTMEDCSSDACKFGARIWSRSDNVIRRSAFRNPVKQGNTKGACVQASGTLVIEDTILEARGENAALTLHELKTGGPPHVSIKGGEIILHENAPLARSTAAGLLELNEVRVNGTLRSGRFDLDKNELR